MTPPRNVGEDNFLLYMALLDADCAEGAFRDGVHAAGTAVLNQRIRPYLNSWLTRCTPSSLFHHASNYFTIYRPELGSEQNHIIPDDLNLWQGMCGTVFGSKKERSVNRM